VRSPGLDHVLANGVFAGRLVPQIQTA
jgi:hypothetical protein